VISEKAYPFVAAKIILVDVNWIEGDGNPLDREHIHPIGPDETCRIFLTSGTTGDEKAIAVTHRNMIERIARQYLHFGSVASFSSRIFVDLGLTTSLGFQLLVATLWRGGALFLTGESQATVSALPIYGVQSMIASPGGLSDFLDAVERRPQYECRFDAIWTGGSSVPAALSERARIRLSANLTIAYGSTEATMVASTPAQFAAGIPGAVGYVFPGIMVQIVDEFGSPVPQGKEGIVRIKSKFGATEYFGDPVETARVFHDGWFHPGDLGYLTRDGMLAISGRAHAVLNVGGEKISPERIEEILLSHPNVMQAAVLPITGSLGMEQVCALVVPRSYLNVEALREHFTGKIARQLIPFRFIAVAEIPKNEAGKIDRRKLPELARSELNLKQP
jgi:acyl-CoA synthetase (AMP-forming)/AMP-acid ligase II